MQLKIFTLIVVSLFITNIFFVSKIERVKSSTQDGGIIADHTIANMVRNDEIPDSAIITAKEVLHIAYEHTSHGSQIPDGMDGLPDFKEGNGGTAGLYNWSDGPRDGYLDLDDDAMASYAPSAADLGYADWALATKLYLEDTDPDHSDVNVIMWSWCGQVGSYDEQGLIDHYLAPMTSLEENFTDVKFVYMTGHVDGYGLEGSVHLRNEQIRDYCIMNDKILFDFADIESYDPDGKYFGDKYVNDYCAWHNDTHSGNWAADWESSHTEDVDWYDCYCAHSRALNGNMKAYAVWWLWARLGGWEQTVNEFPIDTSELFFGGTFVLASIGFIAVLTIATKRKKR